MLPKIVRVDGQDTSAQSAGWAMSVQCVIYQNLEIGHL